MNGLLTQVAFFFIANPKGWKGALTASIDLSIFCIECMKPKADHVSYVPHPSIRPVRRSRARRRGREAQAWPAAKTLKKILSILRRWRERVEQKRPSVMLCFDKMKFFVNLSTVEDRG